MGLFFKSAPLVPTVQRSLNEALSKPPENEEQIEQFSSELATKIDRQVSGQFSWGRFFCGVILLVAILVAGIYTARDTSPEVKEWSKVLLHAFELLLGVLIGLVSGEAISRS
jgi:hypothetical protein